MINYDQLGEKARVWVYQSNKPFAETVQQQLKGEIENFVAQWASHGDALQAWGDVYYDRFIVLMVDEQQTGASGCSIDKSVAFIRSIEESLGVDMFDRWNFAYQKAEKVQAANRDDFSTLYQKGEIDDDTIVFNNLVTNKADFESKWKLRLADSWHRNMV